MAIIPIGKTGLQAEQNAFGALPIQRIDLDNAVRLLRRAREGGMTFFDTARAYSDSEQKLAAAFAGSWDGIILATKTMATTAEAFWQQLHTSLKTLRRETIDIYQFHNPAFCPQPGDGTGLYEAMLTAREQGKIRFIGITSHRLAVARQAIASGLYATLQFPLSYLSTPQELELSDLCREAGMGLIAMKALSGGLITRSDAAAAFLCQYDNILPIWGVQRDWELEEFLRYIPTPPELTPERRAIIEADRQALTGEFCRGCGYCMPCPQGIEINTCARASLLLRRAPAQNLLSEEGQAKMKKIEECIHCGQCAAKCPYGLDTPALLARNYQDFCEVLAGKPL